MLYYIYHIPGTKIGCTKTLEKRISEQGFTEWEVLETHTDGWLAGDREIELQKEYGYPVDKVHYMITLQKFRCQPGYKLSSTSRSNIAAAGIGNQNAVKSKSKRDIEFQQKIDAFKEWSSLLSDYNNGMSLRKLENKYNLCRRFISKVIKKG